MALKKAKLIEKKELSHDVIELLFETEEKFEFEAGQFINIKINDNGEFPCFRAYSICSAPEEGGKQFILCIKVIENGRGSNWLNSLEEGDEIEFIGAIGYFSCKEAKKEKLLFIATGTGIAPLKAMIETELNSGNKKDIELLFGLRHETDVIYREYFEELAEKYDNFSFTITLSRPETEDWDGATGRVTKHLEEMELDAENTETYICGLKAMTEEVTKILKEKGLPEEVVHFEKYD